MVRDPNNVHMSEHEHNMPKPVAAEDLGRLSAEAVQAQYEKAAAAVEEMGTAVKERISKLEGALRETDADMKLLSEAAAAIREKGKLVYLQIEEANILSQDIRAAADGFKLKVGITGK